MQYKKYQRNHAIVKDREKALDDFLNSAAVINGKRVKHKLTHSRNPNSEDALTWSCFDTLRNYKSENLIDALNEILEDSFEGNKPFDFKHEKNVKVKIGKEYIAPTFIGRKTKNENTEVDASIETDSKVIFIEAKLYSSISLPNEIQPHNQIANKLRIGLDYARNNKKKFYFIFLDIAPLEKLTLRKSKAEASQQGSGFTDKWKSAWWFKYYKDGRNDSIKPLADILRDVTSDKKVLDEMRKNMGWLTWASLFKITLRAAIK